MALHDMMAQAHQDPDKKIDGYTPDQRFFLGFGLCGAKTQLRRCLACWCALTRIHPETGA